MKKYVLTTRGWGVNDRDMPDERAMVDPLGMTLGGGPGSAWANRLKI